MRNEGKREVEPLHLEERKGVGNMSWSLFCEESIVGSRGMIENMKHN